MQPAMRQVAGGTGSSSSDDSTSLAPQTQRAVQPLKIEKMISLTRFASDWWSGDTALVGCNKINLTWRVPIVISVWYRRALIWTEGELQHVGALEPDRPKFWNHIWRSTSLNHWPHGLAVERYTHWMTTVAKIIDTDIQVNGWRHIAWGASQLDRGH